MLFKIVFPARSERGAVLVVGLLIVSILTVLSLGAMMNISTELKMAANDRSAKAAFYLAEAGTEEARARLQAEPSSRIADSQPNNVNWKAFLGTDSRAQGKGYQSTNSSHARYDSLYPDLTYVTTITHKIDSSNNILRWGDSNSDGIPEENATMGNNIYVITSEGQTEDGASKAVKVECARVPPITIPSALYTKADATIQGSSTYVIGSDGCGLLDKPGIITMKAVTQNGNPNITGSPPIIENSTMNINIQYMVNRFKKEANYIYNVNSATLTGMNWGSPTPGATQQSPSSCGTDNIVYINTNSTYVKLTGGTSGCGILLVEGDLSLHGGFQWYGPILVTGFITFTGGGGKNVTGGILAGGMVSADLLSGDANIIYCSRAIDKQTNNRPLIVLRWAEEFY